MPGTLFVVATPIGNLEDVTLRALRTLREADLIAAEDTRRTARLLAHHGISRPVVSLREHNEARETPRLIARLQAGERIALVSDAGTPTVSDPGARLIRAVRSAGLTVVPIPGPSAVTAALSASGLGGDQFVFLGFPPATGRAREEWIEAAVAEDRVVVFFEAPHRVRRTLSELSGRLVNRPIIVARELTKIHETLGEWPIEQIPERGEFTIVVSAPVPDVSTEAPIPSVVEAVFGCLIDTAGFQPDRALAVAARAFGVPISRLRRTLKLARYARNEAARRGEP